MMKILRKMICVALTAALCLTFCGCELKHQPGPAATCTEPQVCEKCGEVIKEALGHQPGAEATCTEPQICERCGEALTKALGHQPGAEATCTEPQVCERCGAEIAPAKGHTAKEPATCVADSVCAVCGEVLEKAKGHTPGPAATETIDQVCTVCGLVLKKAIGKKDTSSGGTSSQTPVKPVQVIPETQAGGHYHNNIQAAYAGNVLVCGDYGLEYFGLPAAGNANYAAAVNTFAQKYPNVQVTVELVPKSCAFNAPQGYEQKYNNQLAYINATYAQIGGNVHKADAIGKLNAHKGEYLYYRTDHHWTSLGAYYASQAFCEANGISARALSGYTTVINTGFVGTLYSYASGALKENLKTNPDYTVGHLPNTPYTMTYTTDGVTYKGTAINQNAKTYAGMFICGDQGLVDIKTENHNGKKLLIFKESYGNAFAPYMIDYYEEVVVVDIRYATDSVANIIAKYGITDALIINNVQGASSLCSSLAKKLAS